MQMDDIWRQIVCTIVYFAFSLLIAIFSQCWRLSVRSPIVHLKSMNKLNISLTGYGRMPYIFVFALNAIDACETPANGIFV